MTTFGLSLKQSLARRPDGTFDGDRYLEVVKRAEALGFDHVLAADHVFVPEYWAQRIGDFFLEPFALLAHLAAHTSRIRLVVSCLVVPYRQPIAMAKLIASLDQLSGGRLVVGVVPGYLKEEFAAFNLELDDRGAMTSEFLAIMQRLWTQRSASFEGTYYSFEEVELLPKCAQEPHVPVWIGGSSKAALRRVAEFGDGWHPLGFTVVDEAYLSAHAVTLEGKSLPTSGTSPEDVRRGLAEIQRLAAGHGREIKQLDVIVYPGPPPAAEVGRSLRDIGGRIAVGGQEMIDWLGTYIDAGVTGFVVSPPGDTLDQCEEHLERFAGEIKCQLEGRAR